MFVKDVQILEKPDHVSGRTFLLYFGVHAQMARPRANTTKYMASEQHFSQTQFIFMLTGHATSTPFLR